MKTFRELGLDPKFVALLKKAKITTPTEIQEKVIPLALAGRDVLGGSATGSGKTLVFAATIIQKLKPNKHVQALILTPTRELAEQISDTIKEFSKNQKLGVLPIYGGVNIDRQIRSIYKTDVVVGTPGRIIDHLNRRTLRNVNYLILDEVDRMFDMGFYKDVEKIIRECQKKRQTMLFSATISDEVYYLAKRHTKNPVRISVKSHVDPSKLKQIYYDVEHEDKFSLLTHLLRKEHTDQVLVFCSTRKNVDFVTDNLIKQKVKAKFIHGGIDQKKRTRTLNEFHNRQFKVLVCTDVAARGLDIKGVSHVYNYDLPKTSEEYIHRIGRTARAGEKGEARSLICNRDYENFSNIERDRKLKISKVEVPRFEKVWVDINALKGRRKGPPSRQRDSSRGRSFSKSRSRGKPFSNDRPRGRPSSSGPRGKPFSNDRPRGMPSRGSSSGPRGKPIGSRGRDSHRRPGQGSSPSKGRFNKRPSGKGSRRNFRANSKGRSARKGRR